MGISRQWYPQGLQTACQRGVTVCATGFAVFAIELICGLLMGTSSLPTLTATYINQKVTQDEL